MQESLSNTPQAGKTESNELQSHTASSHSTITTIKACSWLSGLKFWLALVVLIVTVLEGVVFNHFYFRFALSEYQTVSVPLPYNEQLGENAYVFSPNQTSLSLQGIDNELMTIGFKLKGEHNLMTGSVYLTDDSSLVRPIFINKFKVAPADINFSGNSYATIEGAPYKLLVRSKGKAHSIAIAFEQLKGAVILTDLTLNVKPEYSFSLLRWFAMITIGAALIALWQKRLYTISLGQLNRKTFRFVQGLSLALCLGISWGFSFLVSPTNISPNLMFDYVEHGYIHLGNPEQSLLLDYPRTQKELEYHDAYVQTMDALLKGQLHMDVTIDTSVLNAAEDERLYDTGWRAQQGIEGFWDRSFYDNKFYVYYGYGPVLLFYLPLYLITGQVPTPSLAIFFFSTVAVIGQFLAIYAVTRFYGVLPKANALIYGLSQAAAVLGTHLVCVQCSMWFYAYAAMLCVGLIGFFTFLIYSLPGIASPFKKRGCLALIGIVIVLIVQTRPHMLFPAMVIACPILLAIARAKCCQINNNAQQDVNITYSIKDKVIDALFLSTPVAIGAAITMTVNYLRFDSITDFGQRYCLSGENLLFKYIEFNFETLSALSNMFLTQSWVDLQDFPYYSLATEAPSNVGQSILTQNYVGLLASPVWWILALALLLFWVKDKKQHSTQLTKSNNIQAHTEFSDLICHNTYNLQQSTLLKITLGALLILMPIMCYMIFVMIVANVRNLMETSAPLVPFIVLLWVHFINFNTNSSMQAKICYWAGVWALGITVVMEGFAPFSMIQVHMPYLVPDDWISAQAFFSPLSTVR